MPRQRGSAVAQHVRHTLVPEAAHAAYEGGWAGSSKICWGNPKYSQVTREQGKNRAQQDSEMHEFTLNPGNTSQFLTPLQGRAKLRPHSSGSGFVSITPPYATEHEGRRKKGIGKNNLL